MTFPLADAQTGIEWRDSGQKLDRITTAIFIAAEEKLGYPLTLIQGGGKSASRYSGTTHNRYGVADIAAWDWERKCEVFNSLGCYAYHRPPLRGVWGEHVHIGVIDHPWRDPMLAAQQVDWLKNPPLNALSGHARYHDGPTTNGKKIVFQYDPKTKLQVVKMNNVEKARDEIVRGIQNIGDAEALLDETNGRPVVEAQLKKLKNHQAGLREILTVLPKK
jgi:hypothetical protein